MEHTFVKNLLAKYNINTSEVIDLLDTDGSSIVDFQDALFNHAEWINWIEAYTLALIIFTYYNQCFDDKGIEGLEDWDRESYIQVINETVLPLIEFSKTLN